jgi:molybdopterin-guanine dinucleotide biosynthesis protein A
MDYTITGILLAGGQSRRMQKNKAFLEFRGIPLFEYTLNILRRFCKEILISTSDPSYRTTNFPLIRDEIKGAGPLGGIYSCLKKSTFPYALVLPCDLPLLDESIPSVLLHDHKKYDITVPLNKNKNPEPLIGVYSTTLVPLMRSRIDLGSFKLQDLLRCANTRYITPEIEGLKDISGYFRNINTKKDYDELVSKYD